MFVEVLNERQHGMYKYPNLQELLKYHPYSEYTVCDHAGIEPGILHAAFKGSGLLTPVEIISIARLYGCPDSLLIHPKIIMLDMRKQRHKKMVGEVDVIYIQLKDMARKGNPEAKKYLQFCDWSQQEFMRAAHENKLTYCHYLGTKERFERYVRFSLPKPKRRGFIAMKGVAT